MQEAAHERDRYDWIKRLQEADPDSDLLKMEAAIIEDSQTGLFSDTRPDAGLKMSAFRQKDTFTLHTSDLLNRPPTYWVEALNSLGWENPRGLTPPIVALESATTQDPSWGISLAEAMMVPEPKDTPAWSSIINGLNQADLNLSQQVTVLDFLGDLSIQSIHGDSIAEHLHGIVNHGGKPFAAEVIEKAESVASSLWARMECNTIPAPSQGWLQHATSYYGIGYLPLFWTKAAGIRMRHQGLTGLTENCRESLSAMLNDDSPKGLLAQSALSTQTAFLLKADEEWTADNLIPMLTDSEGHRASASWEGFLKAQHIDHVTSQYLGGVMHQNLDAISRMLPSAEDQRNLAKCYSAVLCYYAADPGSWLKETVTTGDQIAWLTEREIRNRLSHADAVQQQDWWYRWIKDYWTDRQQGTPRPLSTEEAVVLWGWATEMPAVYTEVAPMAANTPFEHAEWMEIEPLLDKLAKLPAARENVWETAELLSVLLPKTQPGWQQAARRLAEPLFQAILESAEPPVYDSRKRELVNWTSHWLRGTWLEHR